MELLDSILFLSFLFLIFYVISKKSSVEEGEKKDFKALTSTKPTVSEYEKLQATINNNKDAEKHLKLNNKNIDKVLSEEINRRKRIVSNVLVILDNSVFFEPIAKWREQYIYKFILHNNQEVFEFEDIMPPENQKIGVDNNFLCFKQLFYKKIHDHERISELLEKFKNMNPEKIQYNEL